MHIICFFVHLSLPPHGCGGAGVPNTTVQKAIHPLKRETLVATNSQLVSFGNF